MNVTPCTAELPTDQPDGQYRDDVREILEAEGWQETAEGCVVAPNGALWAETNTALDSGIDAPDKTWSVAFDNNVPAPVIATAALSAAGTDLVSEVRRLRAELATARVQAIRDLADKADPQRPEVSFFGDHGHQVGAWMRKQAEREQQRQAAASCSCSCYGCKRGSCAAHDPNDPRCDGTGEQPTA